MAQPPKITHRNDSLRPADYPDGFRVAVKTVDLQLVHYDADLHPDNQMRKFMQLGGAKNPAQAK